MNVDVHFSSMERLVKTLKARTAHLRYPSVFEDKKHEISCDLGPWDYFLTPWKGLVSLFLPSVQGVGL